MANVIDRIKAKAEQLQALRTQIATIEEAAAQSVAGLKADRDRVQQELLEELKKQGLGSIKTSDGESYTLSKRVGIAITLLPHALKWATENRCVSIDKRMAEQKLKTMSELPAGFERTEVEYISIRKPKPKAGEGEEAEAGA